MPLVLKVYALLTSGMIVGGHCIALFVTCRRLPSMASVAEQSREDVVLQTMQNADH